MDVEILLILQIHQLAEQRLPEISILLLILLLFQERMVQEQEELSSSYLVLKKKILMEIKLTTLQRMLRSLTALL